MCVCKLAKYVRNCVVFWKKYTADKHFTVATNFKSDYKYILLASHRNTLYLRS